MLGTAGEQWQFQFVTDLTLGKVGLVLVGYDP